MKVLLVGVGTVGEAIARLSAGRPWLEQMVLVDHDIDRARRIAQEIGDDTSHPVVQLDASDQHAVEELARAHDVDLVLNAVDPRFVMPVFQAALAADVDYMDLAVSTSTPHPTDPYGTVGRIIGDEQFAMDEVWRERGRLALVGQGIWVGKMTKPALIKLAASDSSAVWNWVGAAVVNAVIIYGIFGAMQAKP